jgi:hypothetical protein
VLICTLLLIPIAVVLTLAGIVVGQQTFQPPAIAHELRQSPDCAFPCWKNITPSHTSVAHANRLISGAGYINETSPAMIADGRFLYRLSDINRCKLVVVSEGATVTRLRLYDCPPTRLGDVMRYTGAPLGIIPDRFALVFQGGTIVVYAQRILCERRFTPDTFVGVIEIRNTPELEAQAYPWRGFIDLRGYMPRNDTGLRC